MYIFSCSDCKTRKTSPVLFLCMQKNVWNDHFNINAIKKALFYVYFFTCWKKGERMSVSQDTKFEDRNGGIMDVQEGHGEIVKRSAGSIVRLVRSSRSRETRYMYSFARLYNVSWEGSLDCLLAYTLPLYVHLRTCECCVYVCVCVCVYSLRALSTVVKNSRRPNDDKEQSRTGEILTYRLYLHWILSPKGKSLLPKCSLIHES